MSLSLFRLCLTTGACAAAIVLAAPAQAGNGYLSWSGKTASQGPAPAVVTTSTGTYAVPPSPYGQVGDPFARTLNWSGRYGAPQTAPQQVPQQVRQAAPQQPPVQVASLTPPPQQPVPVPRAQPVRSTGRYVDTPAPPQQIEPEDDAYEGTPASAPQPAPAPVTYSAPAQATQSPSSPFPKWGGGTAHSDVTEGSAPAPAAPQAAPAQTGPLIAQFDDGSYQVPASSPYAARIAAARAAQAGQQAAEQAPPAAVAAATPPAPATPAPVKTAAKATPAPAPAPVVATAPAPSESLATQETDRVFIPGEQYTSTADAPRFYSLVREYGLKPDPITTDPHATGALLEPLKDVKTDDSDDTDSHKDSDDDSGDDTP